jgi:beta-phosphoglucomutase-like phosphatase (HAD superfamily)
MATMMVISIFLRPLLVFQVASCFLNVPLIHHKTVPSSSAMMMVRNIDLAEAIIFYGHGSLFQDRNELLPGVEYLLQECERDDTVVLAILETTTIFSNLPSTIQVRPETQAPPNPRDLWEAIHSLQVQPKGFGGSSGFGTKAADPERPPLPQHCVVLCHNEDQCRAARYAGMRVLCLTDNDLADGILLDWESICMDDIATPGSFWLNPPHPRDDESNGVDPELVMETYEKW